MDTERRKNERVPISLEVRYATQQGFVSDWIMNLSRGGMFVHSDSPLPVGTVISITLIVPGGQPIEIEGEVKWVVQRSPSAAVIPGMGVKITNISDESRKILEDLVEEAKKQMKH